MSMADAARTSQMPASSGFCLSVSLARAVIRLIAMGMPEVRGVMASM